MANFDLETELRRKQLQKISIIILFRKNGLVLAVEVRGLSPQGFLMHSYQRRRVKMGCGD